MLAAAALIGLVSDIQPDGDQNWRREREVSLVRPQGWLSVSGLFWLRPGINMVGSAPNSTVVLPSHSSPKKAGWITLGPNSAEFDSHPDAPATIGGEYFTSKTIWKKDGPSTRVTLGDLDFVVIQRGSRMAVRLWDMKAERRVNFRGLDWFPYSNDLVVKAKFHKYSPAKKLSIINIIGDVNEVLSPGYVAFKLGGKEHRLDAEPDGKALFFNFQDATNGKSTYGAGRFLDADPPKNGWVTLDFNRAVSPPCAFTDFATCPLPPKGNRISVPVLAGEKTSGH